MIRPVPTALLRHTLPGGSSHLDWLIDLDPSAAAGDTNHRGLLAFRLGERPDALAGEALAAVRMRDHRRLYLEFEGPLAPGPDGAPRGWVERIATGDAWIEGFDGDALRLRLDLGRGVVTLEGRREGGGEGEPAWRFRRVE